jgi:hypothetical protein
MTNHVHLLAPPHEPGAISRMMQVIGRRYVACFNARYRRSVSEPVTVYVLVGLDVDRDRCGKGNISPSSLPSGERLFASA